MQKWLKMLEMLENHLRIVREVNSRPGLLLFPQLQYGPAIKHPYVPVLVLSQPRVKVERKKEKNQSERPFPRGGIGITVGTLSNP